MRRAPVLAGAGGGAATVPPLLAPRPAVSAAAPPRLPLHTLLLAPPRRFAATHAADAQLSPLLAPPPAPARHALQRQPAGSRPRLVDDVAAAPSLEALTALYRRRHAEFDEAAAAALFRQAAGVAGPDGARHSTAYRRLKQYMTRELLARHRLGLRDLAAIATSLHAMREGDLRVWDALAHRWAAAAASPAADRLAPAAAAELLRLGGELPARAQGGRFDPAAALVADKPSQASAAAAAAAGDKDAEVAAHHIGPWLGLGDVAATADAVGATLGLAPRWLPPGAGSPSSPLPPPVSLWCSSRALAAMYAHLLGVVAGALRAPPHAAAVADGGAGGRSSGGSPAPKASIPDPALAALCAAAVAPALDHELIVHGLLEARNVAAAAAAATAGDSPAAASLPLLPAGGGGTDAPGAATAAAVTAEPVPAASAGGAVAAAPGETNILDHLLASLLEAPEVVDPLLQQQQQQQQRSQQPSAASLDASVAAPVAPLSTAAAARAPLHSALLSPVPPPPSAPATTATNASLDFAVAFLTSQTAGLARYRALYAAHWHLVCEPLDAALARMYPQTATTTVSGTGPSAGSSVTVGLTPADVAAAERVIADARSRSYARWHVQAPHRWAGGTLAVLARALPLLLPPLPSPPAAVPPPPPTLPPVLDGAFLTLRALRTWVAGAASFCTRRARLQAQLSAHGGADETPAASTAEAVDNARVLGRVEDTAALTVELLPQLVSLLVTVRARLAALAPAVGGVAGGQTRRRRGGVAASLAAQLSPLEAELSASVRELLAALDAFAPVLSGTQASAAVQGAPTGRAAFFAARCSRVALAQAVWAVTTAQALPAAAPADATTTPPSGSAAALFGGGKPGSVRGAAFSDALQRDRLARLLADLTAGTLACAQPPPTNSLLRVAPAALDRQPITAAAPASAADYTVEDLSALTAMVTALTAAVDPATLPVPRGTVLPVPGVGEPAPADLLSYVTAVHALALAARVVPGIAAVHMTSPLLPSPPLTWHPRAADFLGSHERHRVQKLLQQQARAGGQPQLAIVEQAPLPEASQSPVASSATDAPPASAVADGVPLAWAQLPPAATDAPAQPSPGGTSTPPSVPASQLPPSPKPSMTPPSAVPPALLAEARAVLTAAEEEMAGHGRLRRATARGVAAFIASRPHAMAALLQLLTPAELLRRNATPSPHVMVAVPTGSSPQADADTAPAATTTADGRLPSERYAADGVPAGLMIGPPPRHRSTLRYGMVHELLPQQLAAAQAGFDAARAALLGAKAAAAVAQPSPSPAAAPLQPSPVLDEEEDPDAAAVALYKSASAGSVPGAVSNSSGSGSTDAASLRSSRLAGVLRARFAARSFSSAAGNGGGSGGSGSGRLVDALLAGDAARLAAAPKPDRRHAADGASSDSDVDVDDGEEEAIRVADVDEADAAASQRQRQRAAGARVSSHARMRLSSGGLPRSLSPGSAASRVAAASGASAAGEPGAISGSDDSGSDSDRSANSSSDSDTRAPVRGRPDGVLAARRHRRGPHYAGDVTVSEGESDDSDTEGGAAVPQRARSAAAPLYSAADVSDDMDAAARRPSADASTPSGDRATLVLTAAHRASLVPFTLYLLRRLAAEEAGGRADDAAGVVMAAVAARHLSTLAAQLAPVVQAHPRRLDTATPLGALAVLERALLPALGPADATGGDVAAVRVAIADAAAAVTASAGGKRAT